MLVLNKNTGGRMTVPYFLKAKVMDFMKNLQIIEKNFSEINAFLCLCELLVRK